MLFIPLYVGAPFQVRILWWWPSDFSPSLGLTLSVCAQEDPALGVFGAAAAASQLLGYEALGVPQPPLLQFSSFDHSDIHRNLTMVEKYRSLLVWTNNFLGLISFWVLQYQVVGFISSFGDLCHSAPLLFLTISEPIFLCISNDVPGEFFIVS